MRTRATVALALVALAGLGAASSARAAFEYSPKLGLRTSSGILTNLAPGGGSTLTLGGFNVLFHYFLTPRLSAGFGFKADFSTGDSTIPLKGFDVSGRWYFWNEGTRVRRSAAGQALETRAPWALYLGADLAQRSYFLKRVDLQSSLSGSFTSINALVGIDWSLGGAFELNLEGVATVLIFADSAGGVRIRSLLANAGLGYVW